MEATGIGDTLRLKAGIGSACAEFSPMLKRLLALVLAGTATSALAQTPPPPPAGGPMGAGTLMRADADGDGIVTRAEAVAAAATAFDRVDADRDGKVTAEEMRSARDAMRRSRGGDCPPPPSEQ